MYFGMYFTYPNVAFPNLDEEKAVEKDTDPVWLYHQRYLSVMLCGPLCSVSVSRRDTSDMIT